MMSRINYFFGKMVRRGAEKMVIVEKTLAF